MSAPGRKLQSLPQLPQLVITSMGCSQPSRSSPLQSSNPATQKSTRHVPPKQAAAAFESAHVLLAGTSSTAESQS